MLAITPHALRDSLVGRAKRAISEVRLRGAANGQAIPGFTKEIQIFPRDLPVPNQLDGEYFPCVVVSNGGINQPNFDNAIPTRVVTIDFFIGVYDPDENFPGMDDAMEVAEKLYQNFMAAPSEGSCILTAPISYKQIAGSEKNPYFYTQLTTNWLAPAMQITSEYI